MSNKAKVGVAIAVALILAFSAFIFYLINEKSAGIVAEGDLELSERGSLAWVSAFTGREFNTCDLLVENQNYRLYSPLVITQAQDKRYYERVLQGAVDCIESVRLISVDDNEYKFRVRLYKAESADSFDVDSAVASLRGSYLAGSMTDADFSSALKDIYYSVFSDSCFRLSDETTDFIIVLSDSEVDGVVYVSGTVDFVDLILSESGLSQNFILFESDVKSEVDAVLKAGFD